jgi:hypothetical protein
MANHLHRSRPACGSVLLAATILVLAAGCGGDRPQTISVSGRIALDGGEWPQPGRLTFSTVEPAEGFPERPGTAFFEVDGKFEAFTWEKGDGLMPGKYKVVVECWEVEPTMEDPVGKSYVSNLYTSPASSPLEVAVEPGQRSIKLTWDVPKP